MMKRLISILLICTLILTSCSFEESNSGNVSEVKTEYSTTEVTSTEVTSTSEVISEKVQVTSSISSEVQIEQDTNIEDFYSLNDVELLQYVEDKIYANMTENFASEDYRIESVDAIFISKEYIEELQYNSKENIYFGYTLSELDAQYTDQRYVFTVGDDGKTITQVFEKYDDTYDKIIENVLVGTGVILVCVTVSVLTSGAGTPECINMVFAASAKTGASFAASSGVISFAGTAIVKGIQTKDVQQTLKEAALAGSDGFKWGAITGVVAGGTTKALKLIKSARTIPTHRQSELTVLERTKGGREQVAYLNGEEVPVNTKDCTRPDTIKKKSDGTVHAKEVKNYNLNDSACRNSLYHEVRRQVQSRVINLPKGSTQEIILDVRGRKYDKALIEKVVAAIKIKCSPFYDNIPVKVMAY